MASSDRDVTVSRRALLAATVAAGAALALPGRLLAAPGRYPARPPGGFTRLAMPGKVVRVSKSNVMQPNGLWPEAGPPKLMLERAMAELTGKGSLGEAFAAFVSRDDRVAVKVNGLGGKKGAGMATNKELVVAVVEGLVAAGVPAAHITIYDQFDSFLKGTRVVDADGKLDPAFPAGVSAVIHDNRDAVADPIIVSRISTRFVRMLTEATVVINVPVIKDHGICGYTGAMKNMTHGSIINPHQFHEHGASPQIAELYAQEVIKTRVALHVLDGFKAMYDGGPSDKKPSCRVPHESVYVSTDPVALDVVGWQVVDKLRRDNGLPTLAAAGREPTYLRVAADLGLGVYDSAKLRLRETKL